MVVKNPIGLIGDTLGTFPVLQQLNKDHENFSVIVNEEVKWLYDLVPEIAICTCPKWDKELNVNQAFKMANMHNLYMSQAFYPFMGYPIPSEPVKAELRALDVRTKETVDYDYVFAPFGRSAPQEQKWDTLKWVELAENLYPAKILIIGSSKHDKGEFEMAFLTDNVTIKYDLDIHTLCNALQNAKHGCISIVTGISHLCYHLGVKNYLLANQGMTWGIQPEAVVIDDHIPTLEVKTVYDVIHRS